MKGFVDQKLILSDAQAVTATTSSTNNVKLPNTTVGEGNPLYLHIAVDTAFSSEAGTIAIAIYDSADGTTFAATEWSSTQYTSSLVTANTELYRVPLPSDTRKYVRLHYTCSATPSDGTFDAWISDH